MRVQRPGAGRRFTDALVRGRWLAAPAPETAKLIATCAQNQEAGFEPDWNFNGLTNWRQHGESLKKEISAISADLASFKQRFESDMFALAREELKQDSAVCLQLAEKGAEIGEFAAYFDDCMEAATGTESTAVSGSETAPAKRDICDRHTEAGTVLTTARDQGELTRIGGQGAETTQESPVGLPSL